MADTRSSSDSPAAQPGPSRPDQAEGGPAGPGGPRPVRLRPADRRPGRPRGSATSTGMIMKIILLGVVVGLALYVTPALLDQSSWLGLVLVWLGAAVILVVYLGPRALPLKYLLPGTLLLLVFVIYPILSTVQLSTTNFGDGRRTSKAETITSLVANSVQQVPGSKRYVLSVGTKGSVTEGPFTFFLTDPDTRQVLVGTEDGATPADPGAVTLTGNRVTAAEGYTILNARQVNAASKQLAEVRVPTDKGAIRILGVSSAYEGTATLRYDEASDTLRNTATGETYSVKVIGDSEFFVRADGSKAFDESWKRNIGLANYGKVLSDPNIRNDFVRIFAWTIVFATASVALSFLLGLALAATLNDPRLRGRKVFRSLLLLPYAVPGFISLLVWRSFYNQDFGLINELTGLNVNWLGDPTAAKIAVVLANLWLGFPYMMLICTGALQAIPSDLKEAAAIDGASGFRAFRSVTFPLLLVAVAPLLVASFAFNFNNINAIFLLTQGGPFDPGNPGAGDTDILISYTFRLAFGGSGAQFGFAAAISVLLFVITGLMAALQFRATRALEEVN